MSDTYAINADAAAWTRSGDQVVVLDLRTSTYLATNEPAEVLWSALVDGATADDLVRALCAVFEVDAARARDDVEAFLADLVDRALVTTTVSTVAEPA